MVLLPVKKRVIWFSLVVLLCAMLVFAQEPLVLLQTPVDTSNTTDLTVPVLFICNATSTGSPIANVTLFVDIGGSFEQLGFNDTLGGLSHIVEFVENPHSLIFGELRDTTLQWNCFACLTNGTCEFAQQNFTLSGWDLGNYSNVTKENTIRLQANASLHFPNASGSYLSRIFDVVTLSTWNLIRWTEGVPYREELPPGGITETVAGGANMTGNVLLYHLNEASGTVIDTSGAENNGTPQNVIFGEAGIFNGSLRFNGGSDSLINITDDETFNITAVAGVTLEGWFNISGSIPPIGSALSASLDNTSFNATLAGFIVNPYILRIANDIYAIFYEGSGGDGFVDTYRIGLDGQISQALDVFEHEPDGAEDAVVAMVTDDVFAVVYNGGTDFDSMIATLRIFPNGSIQKSQLDSISFNGSTATNHKILKINGSIFTISSSFGGNGCSVYTFEILPNGTINSAPLDSFNYRSTGSCSEVSLFHVKDNVYGSVYTNFSLFNTLVLETFTIDSDGTIGNAPLLDDGRIFDALQTSDQSVHRISGNTFGIVYHGAANNVSMVTLNLSDPAVLHVLDHATIDPVGTSLQGTNPQLFHVNGDVFGISFSNNDAPIATVVALHVDQNGFISRNNVSVSRLVNNDLVPGMTIPLFGDVYAAVYDPGAGGGGGGHLRTFSLATETGISKSRAYALWANQTHAFSQINEQFLLAPLQEGTYNHLAVTYDAVNGTQTLYVNGRAMARVNMTEEIISSFGQLHAGRRLNGSLDEIALYNRSLSEQEILTHYLRGMLDLTFTTRVCNLADCSDSLFSAEHTESTGSGLNSQQGRFFQYLAQFSTQDQSFSPELFDDSVIIEFSLGQGNPAINITKSDFPDPVHNSSFLNYTLVIENIGNNTAINVTVNETYPPEIIFINAIPAPTSGDNIWELGNISPLSNTTIRITTLVNITTTQFLNNSVEATFSNGSDIFVINQSILTLAQVIPGAPGILDCFVHPGDICPVTYANILHLSNNTDAHAELPNATTDYNHSICCRDTSGFNTLTPFSGFNFLSLSNFTNAHVELPNQTNYGFEAFIGANLENISCNYPLSSGVCNGISVCLATVSTEVAGNLTDLHIADCITDPYETSVCCEFIKAQLQIWDEGDDFPFAQRNLTFGDNVLFFANYTNLTNGAPNSAGICNFTTEGVTQQMEFNATLQLHVTNFTFASSGTFLYSITCADPDFNILTEQDTVTIQSRIDLAKTATNLALNGSSLNYTITITNVENITLFNFTINDTFDENVTFVSSQPLPNASFVWFFPSIAPNQTQTINITVLINQDVPHQSFVENRVNVSFVSASEEFDSVLLVTPVNSTSVINCTIEGPFIGGSCFNSIKVDGIYINSTNINSTINATDEVACTVINSTLLNSTCFNSTKLDSVATNSNNTNSSVESSTEESCILIDSVLINSTCVNSTIINSTKIGSLIFNSLVINSNNNNCTLQNVTEINGTCQDSSITDVEFPTFIIELSKNDTPDPLDITQNLTNLTYIISINNTGSAPVNITVNETYSQEIIFLSADPAPLLGNNIWNFVVPNQTEIIINITVQPFSNVTHGTQLENNVSVTFINGTDFAEVVTTTITTVLSSVFEEPIVSLVSSNISLAAVNEFNPFFYIVADNVDTEFNCTLFINATSFINAGTNVAQAGNLTIVFQNETVPSETNATFFVTCTDSENFTGISVIKQMRFIDAIYFDDMEIDHDAFNNRWSEGASQGNESWGLDNDFEVDGEGDGSDTVYSDSPGEDYENLEEVHLTTPPIDLTLVATATASFWVSFDIEQNGANCHDALIYEVSTDNLTFVPVAPLVGVQGVISTAFGNPRGGELGMCGNTNGVLIEQLNLTPFVGNVVFLRFTLASDASNTFEGVYIDNLIVRANQGSGPAIALTKTDTPDPVFVGENIVYTIRVSNTGDTLARNITLNETYPLNVTFVNAVPAPTVGNNFWELGNITPGDFVDIIITAEVELLLTNGTILTNNITASFETLNSSESTSIVEDTLVLVPVLDANLTFTKSDSPDPVSPGGNIIYQINITNNDATVARHLILNESYPLNVTFISASPAPTLADNFWELGNLSSGESVQVNITVMTDTELPNTTTLINNATVFFERVVQTFNLSVVEPTLVEFAFVFPLEANLSLNKTDFPDPVFNGSLLNYTISVRNFGTETAINVTCNESYSQFVEFSESNPPPTAENSSWFVGDMLPNATFDLNLTVSVLQNASGTILNNVTCYFINGTELRQVSVIEGTTVLTSFIASVIEINKTDIPDPVVRGSNLTYNITFVNTGTLDAINVTLNETYGTVDFISASPPPTAGDNFWEFGNLSPGQVVSVLINTILNSSTTDHVNNTAIIEFFNGTGITLVSEFEQTNVIEAQKVVIIKDDEPDPVENGTLLRYSIIITSLTNETLINLTLDEIFDFNTVFVDASIVAINDSFNTSWFLGNLTGFATVTLNITVNVSSNAALALINNATLIFINSSGGVEQASVVAQTGVFNSAVPPAPVQAAPPRRGGPGDSYCQVEWVCSEWSSCRFDGTQHRFCYDKNLCAEKNQIRNTLLVISKTPKPVETETCDYTPTCDDGITNGDESYIDCGGSCGACGNGAICRVAEDCYSRICLAGYCRPFGTECLTNQDCRPGFVCYDNACVETAPAYVEQQLTTLRQILTWILIVLATLIALYAGRLGYDIAEDAFWNSRIGRKILQRRLIEYVSYRKGIGDSAEAVKTKLVRLGWLEYIADAYVNHVYEETELTEEHIAAALNAFRQGNKIRK